MNRKQIDTLFFLLFAGIGSVSVLIPEYPPLVDVPQHAAQISLFLSIVSGESEFSDLFSINWFTPYWFGYSIIIFLSPLFGVVWATKVTVALAVFAFPLAARRFVVSHGGGKIWGWLFIPLPYGFAYEWGFLNFLIGVSVGFLFLSQVRVKAEGYSYKDYLVALLWTHFLFLNHVLVMAFFLSVAAFMLFNKSMKVWIQRLLPYFLVVPTFVIWIFISMLASSQSQGDGPWGLGVHRFTDFLPTLYGLPHMWVYQVVGFLLCCLPMVLKYRFALSINRVFPFIMYVVLMLVGPNYLFGNFFTYNRFGMVGLPLYMYMFVEGNDHKVKASYVTGAQVFCVLYAAILLVLTLQKSISFKAESRGFSDVLTHMEPEKRALSMIFERHSSLYDAPVYLHFPLWYQAQKKGLVDFNFAYFYPQIIRYKEEARPPADSNFVWFPQLFQYQLFSKQGYEYYVVKSRFELSGKLFPAQSVELVTSSHGWWLYRQIEAVHAASEVAESRPN